MPQSESSIVVEEVISLPSTEVAHDATVVVRTAPTLALLIVIVWVGVILATSSGQWGDHFEHFTWAHSLAWSYHKHPPLPIWVLGRLITALGPAVWSAQLLALLCTLGTAFFTHRVARILFGDAVAALGLLLWELRHAPRTKAAKRAQAATRCRKSVLETCSR